MQFTSTFVVLAAAALASAQSVNIPVGGHSTAMISNAPTSAVPTSIPMPTTSAAPESSAAPAEAGSSSSAPPSGGAGPMATAAPIAFGAVAAAAGLLL